MASSRLLRFQNLGLLLWRSNQYASKWSSGLDFQFAVLHASFQSSVVLRSSAGCVQSVSVQLGMIRPLSWMFFRLWLIVKSRHGIPARVSFFHGIKSCLFWMLVIFSVL